MSEVKGHEESRHNRAEIFAGFIAGEFPEEIRGLVLDVAGGRGDLAFELGVKRGVKVFTVDPRGKKLRKWQKKMLDKKTSNDSDDYDDDRRLMTLFDGEIFENPEIRDARLIAGMHPDEATEEIVDQALKRNISFAVVPCCVFARKFAHSRPDDVRTYEQFIEYLKAKTDGIQECDLGFRGRDKVLYWKSNNIGWCHSSVLLFYMFLMAMIQFEVSRKKYTVNFG